MNKEEQSISMVPKWALLISTLLLITLNTFVLLISLTTVLELPLPYMLVNLAILVVWLYLVAFVPVYAMARLVKTK